MKLVQTRVRFPKYKMHVRVRTIIAFEPTILLKLDEPSRVYQ